MEASPKGPSVLVFCASSRSCDPAFHALARDLGERLARAGMPIIFGGGGAGSMGALADGALGAGGRVVGIQPRFMAELEWTHDGLSELHLVEDMQERKRLMVAQCDAVVALPGGSGTLEELLEVLTAKRLGLFCGPIVLVNQRSYYDPLLAMLDQAIEASFMDGRHRAMWQVVGEAHEVVPALRSAPAWSPDALGFASV